MSRLRATCEVHVKGVSAARGRIGGGGADCRVWHTRWMPMRENCRHFASRTYDDGEVARYCELDLAPEAPWRCPENCAHFAPGANDGSFVTAGLTGTDVEEEPTGETPEAVADLLDDAERILDE